MEIWRKYSLGLYESHALGQIGSLGPWSFCVSPRFCLLGRPREFLKGVLNKKHTEQRRTTLTLNKFKMPFICLLKGSEKFQNGFKSYLTGTHNEPFQRFSRQGFGKTMPIPVET